MTETTTVTLADFLLARIAEDEAVARAATPGPWWWNPEAERDGWGDGGPNLETVERGPVYQDGSQGAAGYVVGAYGYDAWGITVSDEDAEHIAAWDPARVLAECQAKRRIVEWHQNWPVLVETPPEMEVDSSDVTSYYTMRMSRQIMWATEQEYRNRFGTEPPSGPILRLLALPYADHPDYREDWRP